MTKLHSIKPELTKVNSLFIDLDILAKHIDKNEHSKIDYRKIGMIYKGKKLNLSQIMYNTVESKHGGCMGKIIIVDESSYDDERCFIVNGIIMTNHNMVNRQLSASHILETMRYQVQFVDWLRTERVAFPKNVQQAKESFLAYKKHLQALRKI